MDNMNAVWEIISFGLGGLFFCNLLFSVVIVFFERRDPKSVWAWLLLLLFLPGVGFIFYLLLGGDMHKRKMFRDKELEEDIHHIIRDQKTRLQGSADREKKPDIAGYTDLIMYNMETADAILLEENDIDIFTDGNEKFDALIADMEKAEHFIHLQYYIIRNDVLFQRIAEVLKRKAAEGVTVRILFDGMGCRGTKRSCWKQLEAAGVHTAEFFPAILGRLQLRINYRNHRKIVVIDNKTAYVGGFNIGREYIGLDEKFGYWRDTHLRIRGTGVMGLQLRFVLDWDYAAGEHLAQEEEWFREPPVGERDHCDVQIISSGPDNSLQQIRDNYIRLITKAKKRICIQTPYFIPDEAVLTALLIAVRSGIEVNLMIPCKPDHPFVYWATYSYMGQLLNAGANCYIYENGFLHSKGIVLDGEVFCYGTANMDIRSFALNFEVNAVVYSAEKAGEMERLFQEDLKHCTQVTRDLYAARKLKLRFKEQVCRLMSPLL
ncbi:MAG: cardiolipin synthase [Firmicutes bacterium]|nr:cardiolipin synthase [Bacillota bacterium]